MTSLTFLHILSNIPEKKIENVSMFKHEISYINCETQTPLSFFSSVFACLLLCSFSCNWGICKELYKAKRNERKWQWQLQPSNIIVSIRWGNVCKLLFQWLSAISINYMWSNLRPIKAILILVSLITQFFSFQNTENFHLVSQIFYLQCHEHNTVTFQGSKTKTVSFLKMTKGVV